ncbi:hypothetical protein KSP39_PZI017461 [Platanthera zijinensis]|uniref:Serine-threonine/tyrosine-protein kinase catalytic domain-containing protein n=1 Tax=Platanthera zijinensis TaxID=2320716 RepID=A0AAP0FZD6_9ASPA
MLWELLHNKLPFEGMSNLQASYAAFKNVWRSAENLPEDMAAILTSCWEVNLIARPSTYFWARECLSAAGVTRNELDGGHPPRDGKGGTPNGSSESQERGCFPCFNYCC